MTVGLRKLHKSIWLFLTLTVPVLIVFAIKDLNFSSQTRIEKSQETQVGKTAENEVIRVSLINKGNSPFLQIILKKPLKHPSSNVYTLRQNKKGQFIGQLNSVGIYRFEVKDIPKAIMVYDDIKNAIITQINLPWE